jgi:hypothetical protein
MCIRFAHISWLVDLDETADSPSSATLHESMCIAAFSRPSYLYMVMIGYIYTWLTPWLGWIGG